MELADHLFRRIRNPSSGKHLPQDLSVYRIVGLLEIDEAHVQWYSPSSFQFLESAHYEQHVDGGSIKSDPALFLRQYPVRFAIFAEAVSNYLQKHFPCVRY